MEFEKRNKMLDEIHEEYKEEIKRLAVKHGGMGVLSQKLGRDVSYISASVERGSLNLCRKIIGQIMFLEERK